MHRNTKAYTKFYMKESNKTKKPLTFRTLTKKNVWDIQENDILRMWESAEKDVEIKENILHYLNIIRTAFVVEELKDDNTLLKSKYEKLGYKVAQMNITESSKLMWAIKKRSISRVSDLTYENIQHISAAKLVEVLERNFGGGWDSLSQSIKDIIESGFDISTTTLPQTRLHKPGGMYEKKVADGYDVLEVPKGTWVEAIFVKLKPQQEKPRLTLQSKDEDDIPEDTYNLPDEDDDIMEPTDFSDEDITEENYRTTFQIDDDTDEESGDLGEYVTED